MDVEKYKPSNWRVVDPCDRRQDRENIVFMYVEEIQQAIDFAFCRSQNEKKNRWPVFLSSNGRLVVPAVSDWEDYIVEEEFGK